MKYTKVTNLQWVDKAKTMINMLVTFDDLVERPFTASPDDIKSYGKELFNRAAAGDFGNIAAAPEQTLEAFKSAMMNKVAFIYQYLESQGVTFGGLVYALGIRNDIRWKIADAQALGDGSVNVQSGEILNELPLGDASELADLLSKQARDLSQALKQHQESIAQLTEKNYAPETFWP